MLRLLGPLVVLLLAGCHGASSPTPSGSPGGVATVAPSTSPAVTTSTTAPPAAATWTRLDASGPAAREDQTWTVDGAGRYAYLFGGRGSEVHGDLWRYEIGRAHV